MGPIKTESSDTRIIVFTRRWGRRAQEGPWDWEKTKAGEMAVRGHRM